MREGRRGIILFAIAVAVAIATVLVISVSLGAIRDSVRFSTAMRRIDRGDVTPESLLDAAQYARGRGDWEQLLHTAWTTESAWRWSAVRDLSILAADHFPRDDRWRFAAALASIRLGDRDAARDVLPLDGDRDTVGDLEQSLLLLATIDRTDPEGTRSRLADLAAAPTGYPILRAVGTAETRPAPDTLRTAWERTGVSAYAVNAALEAAAIGDRAAAEGLVSAVRTADAMPSAQDETAPLYLAAWLGDLDWLFQQLRALQGTRAVDPAVLLIQADGLVRQGQLDEARRFYRELQTVAPTFDPLAFLNDAAITDRLGDGDPVSILRAGLHAHPDADVIRGDLAGLLIARDQRLDAARIIAPSLVLPDDGPQRYRDWLLTRAVLGARRPLPRLESDLWQYLNDHPDADIVAGYLARFLSLRNDMDGMRRLAARYAPEDAEWSATLHLRIAVSDGDPGTAESILASYPDDSWTARFNRVVFALRFLPEPEATGAVEDFSTWLDRGPALDADSYGQARIHLWLARAELERLFGDREAALQYVDRAERLNPDDAAIDAYRGLLAAPQ